MQTQTTERTNIEPEFLRPPQAAKLLGISRRYLSHLTAIGVVPVYRLGKHCVRYSRQDLIKAMATFRREA